MHTGLRSVSNVFNHFYNSFSKKKCIDVVIFAELMIPSAKIIAWTFQGNLFLKAPIIE